MGREKAQADRGVCQEGGKGNAAAEKKSATMLLLTFMIAAGALTGEAFYGVEAAILAVLDEISLGGNLLKTYSFGGPLPGWQGFVNINLALGVIVYVLFRKAGIIGGGSGENLPEAKETTSKVPSPLGPLESRAGGTEKSASKRKSQQLHG
ncbi:MAG: hypothetical protein Ct9H90mP24_1900 [Methanobacteriota archaeon]|nr:MAG: hypothetical protein Ct9H90mP24_1900 [Euryarchaeota archaeon]